MEKFKNANIFQLKNYVKTEKKTCKTLWKKSIIEFKKQEFAWVCLFNFDIFVKS